MSTTLTRTLPTSPLAPIRPTLAVVCMVSLLGLMLSAVVLLCVSSETSSMMFSSY
jgi:LPS O-antigen subunit length determinant protein (WzzB/FepE family)